MDNIDPALLQRIVSLLQQNAGSGLGGGPMANTATPPPMPPTPTGMPGPGPAQMAPQQPNIGQHLMPQVGGPVDPRQMVHPGMPMNAGPQQFSGY